MSASLQKGDRVELSAAGRAALPLARRRIGTVVGFTRKRQSVVYVQWDGASGKTRSPYHETFLDRVAPDATEATR